jgi:hypothetical protein
MPRPRRTDPRRRGLADSGPQPQRDPLADARSCRHPHRLRQADRGAVDLRAGVDPVALILGLEDVALEGGLDPQVRADLAGQGGDVVEAVDRLLERHEIGEAQRPALAAGGDHPHLRPSQRRQRVQQAEADAVAVEGGVGDAVEGEGQRSVGAALDGGVPREADVVPAMLGAIAAGERRLAALEGEPREPGRNRPPLVIAHRPVDATHDLASAGVDVADVAGFDDQRERAGANGQALGQRRVAAVDEAGLFGVEAGVGHRPIMPGCTPCSTVSSR